ncbi:DUF4270 domain-containing protein [Xanthomarina sp. F1114]|uniref:DUF4270 domain-containing protein n=1 Tax=Xanthomarina sp. F1114 TaxID=2996019 RepID=UPI00225E042E|nr:DUF4270 domain-containing protein [Xanthomarina sp. F1114]MCX7546424.1 DUF4270 domain-containing protein [Xanthomarina sp. F1114]
MKRIIKVSKFISILSLIGIAFIACDNDYNSLESDIEGIQNFGTSSDKFPVVAYNKRIKPLQTSNFPSNFLGIYSDPIYSETTNEILTQVVPANGYLSPDFGRNPEVSSVYLTIPYFSSETGESGMDKYELDSLYGDKPIKLTIYRSNYFLRDYNAATEDTGSQLYYSNNSEFGATSNLKEKLYESEAFFPSKLEQTIYEENEEGEPVVETGTIPPSLRVKLLNPGDIFWKTLLFDKQGMPELSNTNNFKDYFRGLYFKVELANDETTGNAIMLNFDSSAANLTVNYSNEEVVLDDNGNIEEIKLVRNNKYIMNFKANRASTITVDPVAISLLNNANDNADKINGDQNLYLKGGEGAIAIVDLFKDPAVLDEFNLLYKDTNGEPSRLINEANLIFYVDEIETSQMTSKQDPDRVILYDIKNNIPIVDYFYDTTTNTNNPVNSKLNYSSRLEEDASGNGKYKIRVTEHLNNILLRDSTNLQLGLYVTSNINEIINSYVLNDGDLEGIPIGTALSQKGTVLHGSNLNVPEDKRVQLEIYYTQPDN